MALPEQGQALQMSVEELAGYLVLHHKDQSNFNVHNVMCSIDNEHNHFQSQPVNREKIKQYKEALVEAYAWGFTEGLFTFDPNNMINNWWRVSRRGRLLTKPVDVLTLASRELLPKAFLHPTIAEYAAPIFHAGRFDSAVFEAFKQVEIAVRQASGLKLDGASLMKTAFSVKDGRLNDLTEQSEKEGLMFVFAGAIQLFRNASGHKNQDLTPQEAAHLLIHASFLLSMVEARCKRAE